MIEAAQALSDDFTRETRVIADGFVTRLEAIERLHGLKLVSVRDRVSERFVRPLTFDRVLSLVEPAMRDAQSPSSSGEQFASLTEELDRYIATSSSTGLETPNWIRQLAGEVKRVQQTDPEDAEELESRLRGPQRRVSVADLRAQLEQWGDDD